MVVIKSEHGHFATEASVDGRQMAFMVDTGATEIALRESDAARLGYRPAPRTTPSRSTPRMGRGGPRASSSAKSKSGRSRSAAFRP